VGLKIPHFGGNLGGKVKTVSSHKPNLIRWKFAAVCRKIATFCPKVFNLRPANGFCATLGGNEGGG